MTSPEPTVKQQPDTDVGHVMPPEQWAAVQAARAEHLRSIGEAEDDHQ